MLVKRKGTTSHITGLYLFILTKLKDVAGRYENNTLFFNQLLSLFLVKDIKNYCGPQEKIDTASNSVQPDKIIPRKKVKHLLIS